MGEVFDTISYCKGAAVIRMLEAFLGKEVFRAALKNYLNHFKYANAVTGDLWRFLAAESKKSVALIMESWTKKQGFPVISASRSEDGAQLTLSQRRFLISGEDEEKTLWTVPLCLRIDGQEKATHILLDAQQKTFAVPKNAKFIHINAESTGFYCSRYDEAMSAALSRNLSALSIVDRLCLIRDLKALAVSGVEGATVQLLDIICASEAETEYAVWNGLLQAMGDIVHIIDGEKDIMRNVNSIMCKTLSKVYARLGFDFVAANSKGDEEKEKNGDSAEDETTSGLFRPLIVGAMAKYGDAKVLTQISERFTAFMADGKYDASACASSLRSVVFAHAIKHGGEKEFLELKAFYNATSDAMQKNVALRALGNVRYSDEAISALLEWVIGSEEVRSQDKVFPYRALSGSGGKGRDVAWTFLQKRWAEWFKLFEGGFLVQHLAKIPSSFVTAEKAKEVAAFYETIEAPACKRAMQQCVENIEQNAAWRTRELENIRKWAQQNNK